MPPDETQQLPLEPIEELPPIQCEKCRAAFEAPEREATAFLLVDSLTLPIVGCSDHLEHFRTICGHTSQSDAELLQHRPAGGIACPGCRLAPYNPYQPMIPLGDGLINVLACQPHQTEIIDRFETGLQTQQQITSSIDTF